ncbi:DEAD/DEAH box helicase [Corynebacterium sp. Q4381]|uniref:DEAD/DEAH box helicase n=1 Tax=Corynebacterium sp. Marseille-Q4381 TaxID=3121597 RepID=UPI002FE62E97
MFGMLRSELSSADSFIFSVAFISTGGIGTILEELAKFKGQGTIITSTLNDFNEPAAFRELLKFDHIDSYVIEGPHHAKGYIFDHDDHVTAIVGSSNLTRSALLSNQEWNLHFSTHQDGDIAVQLKQAVHNHLARAVPLTEDWIERYEQARSTRAFVVRDNQPILVSPGGERIEPNKMQHEALGSLREVVDSGAKRALIISATGTGKTILAALAAREMNPGRILFLVHREQILRKAADAFARVLEIDPSDIGFFVGTQRDIDARVVFSTVQTLSRPENLFNISPTHFDMVIVDEVHRSGGETYQRILNHFDPGFTLGLTATPERSDRFNVFELFDYNVPYEIRLEGALENHMLVPFDYYGVTDYESARGSIGDSAGIDLLTSPERVDYIAQTLETYSFAQGTKGLIFCSRIEEADRLSQLLNQKAVHGKLLRTVALKGEHSTAEREAAIRRLEDGELDYILSVDIFNEGVDVPAVNVVVLLRSTESSIIFTQQLGRGLRKADGKKSLRVIDFIGNYANNYLIPIALTGGNPGDKDRLRDNMRRKRREPIAGSSTVSFDEVATQRVLESLQKARISDRRVKRGEIERLRSRLNVIPRLADFLTFETLDPFVLAATDKQARNYWALLKAFNFVESGPSQAEDGFLSMLSVELLNGKRPQELLLLRELLRRGPNAQLSTSEFAEVCHEWSPLIQTGEPTLTSVERVLNLKWSIDAAAARYGGQPLVLRADDSFKLGSAFAALYYAYQPDHPDRAESFRFHVDDVIETGLRTNALRYGRSDTFVPQQTYSRKDASRLLNWSNNRESTIYGYSIDAATKTCPIFVTYHKDADVAANIRYEDELIDPSTMRWFSRHGKTLKSRELQAMFSGEVDLYLFVKREDADGSDFYYLGRVDAEDPQQTTMRGDKGKDLDVVTTMLKIRVPIDQSMFNVLTASKLAPRG